MDVLVFKYELLDQKFKIYKRLKFRVARVKE